MRILVFFFLLCRIAFFGVDFDCVVVGSSPFSLIEALYRAHLGERVLILEEAGECGGAWKSITVCGIPHADLGCHQIGQDTLLRSFLEEYIGCHMVSLDNPLISYSQSSGSNGYYFSRGCFELIDNLEKLLRKTDALLLLNHRLETVSIDPSQSFATVKTKEKQFTTSKVIVTQMSSFQIENLTPPQSQVKSKYYHLYLLIQDPTPPRFCYQGGVSSGVSRLMNLTHFVGLTQTGQQLLVIQTHSEQSFQKGETYLKDLKSRNLVSESAYILKSESYIYEQGPYNCSSIRQLEASAQALFETINTGHFQSLSTYVPKWKRVLRPFDEAMKG